MIKVITYGTYDLLHYGHIRLLERAKALGDYLIVGVTADDYDKARGKINVRQTLMERVEAIRATGLANEIIVEEYEGQKIDDIRRYDIDIFTVGSDWEGKFDYLKEYCRVVYLDRTEGISSTDIRMSQQPIRIGMVGETNYLRKFLRESAYVNGVKVTGICTAFPEELSEEIMELPHVTECYSELLDYVDAVYLISHPRKHYEQICEALERGKHVLCESPIALKASQYQELYDLAQSKHCILMASLKTAYATAYSRLLLMVKTGCIGEVVSVDATCTSLRSLEDEKKERINEMWNSLYAWGPTAMLPVFQILGTKYENVNIVSKVLSDNPDFDVFSRITFVYPKAVASIKVGNGVKSEGELIISGTKGYVYVPAPWWKTDYFEVRYENMTMNRRYFYQLDGEGIRYEIVAFIKAIATQSNLTSFIPYHVEKAICNVMELSQNKLAFI